MRKNAICDNCGAKQKDEFDGSFWSEFDDNYEEVVREFWLCKKCDVEKSKAMGSNKS